MISEKLQMALRRAAPAALKGVLLEEDGQSYADFSVADRSDPDSPLRIVVRWRDGMKSEYELRIRVRSTL